MRPWLSGITGSCQDSVAVSITAGRTNVDKSVDMCIKDKSLTRTYFLFVCVHFWIIWLYIYYFT